MLSWVCAFEKAAESIGRTAMDIIVEIFEELVRHEHPKEMAKDNFVINNLRNTMCPTEASRVEFWIVDCFAEDCRPLQNSRQSQNPPGRPLLGM